MFRCENCNKVVWIGKPKQITEQGITIIICRECYSELAQNIFKKKKKRLE